ncbi:MAG TPA: GAF domain-containing sensor histidine kinase [Anaerolineae bacterium]|nr:GAF domain-containing sensor histidine kinase [Anaerolineae bacterium]
MLLSVIPVLLLSPSAPSAVEENLPRTVFILVFITAVFNLLAMVLLIFDVSARLMAPAGLIVDTFVTIALLLITGEANSPLFYYALFPILTSALRFNPIVDLITTTGISLAYFGMGGKWPGLLVPVGMAVVAGVLGTLIRRQTFERKQVEEEHELQRLRSTRDQSRAIFEMASTLSATLNYQRILDAVLDVSILGLKEMGPASTRIISMVLLLSTDCMVVAASRHLTSRDEKLTLQLHPSGSVSRALAHAEPIVCNDLEHDPELTTYTALHRCISAVCVPLRAGFENYGVAVFASPDQNVFTSDNIDVLTAVCNQATIALQNAQLFESLQAEKARIVEIEEDARKKLARDLHDGPTQSVAAIAMRVNYARTLLDKSPAKVPEELEKIETLARSTTKEIRQMLFTLRPLILETQGLKAALETLVQKLHDTDSTLSVHLVLDENAEKLDKDSQGMIFYVVEEAVGNARKHAEATDIWIGARRDNDSYLIEVRDNGKGFDVGKVQASYDKRGSLGMVNMSERAEVLKAKLSIASATGQGTRVMLRFPLERIQS